MPVWMTVRTFRTARFIVALQWEHEQDEDLSWMDDADHARLDSGEWTNCTFRVAVFLDGRKIAAHYLGNSVYEDPADFGREHYGHNHTMGRAYFPDMLRDACREARQHVRTMPSPPSMRTED